MNSGSQYYNYKQRMSVVLMAITDAKYTFIAIDVGQSGSNSDGGIWDRSIIGTALEEGNIFMHRMFPCPLTCELLLNALEVRVMHILYTH